MRTPTALCCVGIMLAAACGGDHRSVAETTDSRDPKVFSLAVPGRSSTAPSAAAWGKTVAVVVSGGNVAPKTAAAILSANEA